LEHRFGPIGELQVADSRVPEGSIADAEVALDAVDGGVEVTGTVSAPWTGECRRCLKPIEGQLHCRVREMYRPRDPADTSDDDEETYPLHGEFLDLAPLVRDALILELPIAPVCREDCQGLCPTCGMDRNEGPCGCPDEVIDPRWSVLDILLDDPGSAESDPSA
jgi:uncharacterized protein